MRSSTTTARRLRAADRPAAGLAAVRRAPGAGTGSTWSASPRPTATSATTRSPTPGATATTSSAPSTTTSPTTSSSASNWPATSWSRATDDALTPPPSTGWASGTTSPTTRRQAEFDDLDDIAVHDRRGLPGPDAGLRPLPRSQVRPDRQEDYYSPAGLPAQHHALRQAQRRPSRTSWPPWRRRPDAGRHRERARSRRRRTS